MLIIGSLISTKHTLSRTILEKVVISYSNIYEKEPLSSDSKPTFSIPPLIAINIGSGQINVLYSDVYFIINVIESLIVNIKILIKKYINRFFVDENMLEDSQSVENKKVERVYGLSDCISLLPKAYIERFGESITKNDNISTILLLDVL